MCPFLCKKCENQLKSDNYYTEVKTFCKDCSYKKSNNGIVRKYIFKSGFRIKKMRKMRLIMIKI